MPATSLNAAHLHIGVGRLGLGLIAAAGLEAELDVHLVAREASKISTSAKFHALVKGEHGEERLPLPVSTVCKSDRWDSLTPELRQLCTDVPELLVTVAATTAGLQERHRFLLDLGAARGSSPPAVRTVFIPCENDPGHDYPALKKKLEGLGVECRDTMVNRLCADLHDDTPDKSVEVVVDDVREWVIEGCSSPHHTLAALEGLSYVDFVADIRPYETRKRWLVNGAHLALAILAHARNIPTINAAAASEQRREKVAKVHEALIEALELRHPGMSENSQYARKHIGAWMRHEDEVSRILKRLRRSNLEPFFDDLERKLIEPIRMVHDLDRFPPVLYVLSRLHRVLMRAKSYVDYAELPAVLPQVSTAADVRAYRRYRELLAPIVGEELASKRAENFGMALETHRLKTDA
jgi:hypothetical protein